MSTPEINPSAQTPIALTIAGSDSGGGAGIQADLKVFSALGVYGASVITAVTAQNTREVTAVHDVPGKIVRAQIQAVFDDLDVSAVKIGMLSSPEIIQIVAEELKGCEIPVVLDPVMVAKSGDKLLQQNAVNSLREMLLPQATLLTPNLPEASTLLECDQAEDEYTMQQQGESLLALGGNAVLMKGGHATGSECTDLLITKNAPVLRLRSKRIDTTNTHGTGCTLSSAIAANLARGLSLPRAVELAHAYLNQAIRWADRLTIGSGYGPVHHFFDSWVKP